MIVVILGWLQSQPWYLIFTGAVVVFFVTFWGFKQRGKKALSGYSNQETEALIHKWIDKPNFKIERLDRPDALFSFVLNLQRELTRWKS